jgi:putative hydrolase of the HAD superfamily
MDNKELLKGIKNIIFDLGGVVINIDYKITINAFRNLGLIDPEKVYTQHKQLPVMDQYDIGEISSEIFVSELRKVLAPGTSDRLIIDAWNAMLLDFPQERADLLMQLKGKYRTFLLSNTNDLHITCHFQRIHDRFGCFEMNPFFEKEYYSHRVGMRKPNKEIFDFVINENGLIASETLFIDDTLQHVEGARRAGLRAYHLQGPLTILDIFKPSFPPTSHQP